MPRDKTSWASEKSGDKRSIYSTVEYSTVHVQYTTSGAVKRPFDKNVHDDKTFSDKTSML
jgi:hypothetical protein